MHMNSWSHDEIHEHRRAALRGLGACCALGSVVLHGLLVPDHLEEKFCIGVLFAVGSASCSWWRWDSLFGSVPWSRG